MENKQKLLKIISESMLENDDRKMWNDFFDSSPENALEAYAEVFSVFPEEIGWFNAMMKRKISAMTMVQSGDAKGEDDLKEIIEEEKAKLIELSKRF